MGTIKPALTVAVVGVAAFAWSPTVRADDSPPPCTSAQLVVTALPMEAGVSHRGVPLVFALAPGATPYTDLLVTAPDTTGTVTVPTAIDTCQLQVHPVTSA